MAWNLEDTYVFSGLSNGSTIPAPTSFASPSTGQAWTDVQGGVYSISGGLLFGTTDALNSRVVTNLVAGVGAVYNVHRYQRSGATTGNCYIVGLDSTSGVKVYAQEGTSNSTLTQVGGTQSFAYNSAHAYQLDTSVIGSNPTTINVTLTDLTSSTVVVNYSPTDSKTALQNSGAHGLDITTTTGTAVAFTNKYTQIQSYSYSAVVLTPTNLTLPQSNVYFTPGWNLATSGHAITNAIGNNFKANFTTGATADFSVSLSGAIYGAINASYYPYLVWSIDNGPLQSSQIASGNLSPNTLVLAYALAAGTHTLQLWVKTDNPDVNHWSPGDGVDVIGFGTTNGTLVFTPLTPQTNILLAYGDSITGGYRGENSTDLLLKSDATHGYAFLLAKSLDAEFVAAGWSGASWNAVAGDGITPGLITNYNLLYSGVSRSFTGITHVLVNMGTNGGLTAGQMSTFLTSLRSALPAGCKIICLVPFNGANGPAILTDFTTYQGSVQSYTLDSMTIRKGSADANCILIDLGARGQVGLSGSGGSIYSYDNTHPSQWGHARLAAMLSRAVGYAFAPVKSYSFS